MVAILPEYWAQRNDAKTEGQRLEEAGNLVLVPVPDMLIG